MTAKRNQPGEAPKPSRIILGANPDIAAAGKLCQRLKKCAAKNTNVNLYADKVETIDTVTLQLLLSFVRQVCDNGNQVVWKSPSPALLKIAGLTGLQAELLLADAAD